MSERLQHRNDDTATYSTSPSPRQEGKRPIVNLKTGNDGGTRAVCEHSILAFMVPQPAWNYDIHDIIYRRRTPAEGSSTTLPNEIRLSCGVRRGGTRPRDMATLAGTFRSPHVSSIVIALIFVDISSKIQSSGHLLVRLSGGPILYFVGVGQIWPDLYQHLGISISFGLMSAIRVPTCSKFGRFPPSSVMVPASTNFGALSDFLAEFGARIAATVVTVMQCTIFSGFWRPQVSAWVSTRPPVELVPSEFVHRTSWGTRLCKSTRCGTTHRETKT